MAALVPCQIASSGKASVTPHAFINSPSCLEAQVFCQITFSGKESVTAPAYKNSLTRVEVLLVSSQNIHSPEAFITISALIGLLTRVATTVSDQGVFFCITFIASLALIKRLIRGHQQKRVVRFEKDQVGIICPAVAVGITVRWQTTDSLLTYLTFAVMWIVEKWLKRKPRKMLFTHPTRITVPNLRACVTFPCIDQKSLVSITVDLHIGPPRMPTVCKKIKLPDSLLGNSPKTALRD